MKIDQVHCPKCGQPVLVCEYDAGTSVVCPACHHEIEVEG